MGKDQGVYKKKEMAGEQFAGTDHLERAYEWCQKIGRGRNADMEILLTAALLHDIGLPIDRKKHYEPCRKRRSIEKIPPFLEGRIIKRIEGWTQQGLHHPARNL